MLHKLYIAVYVKINIRQRPYKVEQGNSVVKFSNTLI